MHCIVLGCNVDSKCSSTSEDVHKLPADRTLREAWLRSLEMEGWELTEDSVVCSKHFQKDDLYISRDKQWSVRAGAVPTADVRTTSKCETLSASGIIKVCRICLASDCRLYPMTKYKDLDQAYEVLTGLSIENNGSLPPYLCAECSHRLLNCIRFRTRGLQANFVLQKIIQKHDHLTLEAIKSCKEYKLLGSKLCITHKQSDHYDLDIRHLERESIHIGRQGQVRDSSDLYDDNVHIKLETNDTLSQAHYEDQEAAYDYMCPPRLHEVTLPGIKLEEDDVHNLDNLNHEYITNDYKDSLTIHDTMGFKVKVETIEATDQNCDEDDSSHVPHGEQIGEDYSSDDGLSLGEHQLGGNLTRKVKKVPEVPYFTKTTVDQHWRPLAESADMILIDDKLPSEIYSYKKNSKMMSFSHMNTNAEAMSFNSEQKITKIYNKQNLKFNVRKSAKNKEHLCNVCKKSFSRKYKLQLHLRMHSGERPFSCEVCENAFNTKHMLIVHMRIHSGEKPYKCSVCEKTFSQNGNLSKHLRVHSGEKPFSCSVCDKSFTQKSNLAKHYKTHSGEKPYLCKLCNKGFNQFSHLENHLRTHSGEKPYSCNICNKLFTIKGNLNKHLRLHSGEKRYLCQYCNKGFNEKNRFQTHLRVHSGKKPFSCEVCEKAFSARSCLQSHLKTHSDQKPFVCNYCKKAFKYRNRLVSHLKTHSF